MSLKQAYNRILNESTRPEEGVFITEVISKRIPLRIGIDHNANPVVLLPEFENDLMAARNYKLKNIEVKYHQSCRFVDKEIGEESNYFFSYLKLVNADTNLLDYFLVLMQIFIEKVEENYTSKYVSSAIEHIIDLFSKQHSIELDIILGLWGELFFIYTNEDIPNSIRAWHNETNSLLDFTFNDKICFEVKTTIRNKRVHNFSLGQLRNYFSFDTLIFSVMTEKSDLGISIKELWKRIEENLDESESELRIKIADVISSTLKNDISALEEFKFNLELADSSSILINSKDIPVELPVYHECVENVKFEINLDKVIRA